MKYWMRESGTLGMVTPIGTANAEMAEPLRQTLSRYSIIHLVSLEWMKKEIFPDADTIPILLFIKTQPPTRGHTLTVVSGLRHKSELRQAVDDPAFFDAHASQLDYRRWLNLSPAGDWPLEVKAEDMPVLEKLKQRPVLGANIRTLYAVKLGGKAKITRPYEKKNIADTEVPFLMGQHICAFSVTEADEVVDLGRLNQVSDASIWKDLEFYEKNEGRTDVSGVGRHDYE